MGSPESKKEYLSQCEAIVAGVSVNAIPYCFFVIVPILIRLLIIIYIQGNLAKQESILTKKTLNVDDLKLTHQTVRDMP